jgi:hypothetical protein
MIRHVTDSDLASVRAFLESHVDTSLFLLSTLSALGPRLGSHLNSGNFRLIEEDGRIVAVCCLTRRGNLLVQAGGRTDVAEQIFEACETESIEVRGIVGEWATAEALWNLLRADPRFESTHTLKDVLYRLMLEGVGPRCTSAHARAGLCTPLPRRRNQTQCSVCVRSHIGPPSARSGHAQWTNK